MPSHNPDIMDTRQDPEPSLRFLDPRTCDMEGFVARRYSLSHDHPGAICLPRRPTRCVDAPLGVSSNRSSVPELGLVRRLVLSSPGAVIRMKLDT